MRHELDQSINPIWRANIRNYAVGFYPEVDIDGQSIPNATAVGPTTKTTNGHYHAHYVQETYEGHTDYHIPGNVAGNFIDKEGIILHHNHEKEITAATHDGQVPAVNISAAKIVENPT